MRNTIPTGRPRAARPAIALTVLFLLAACNGGAEGASGGEDLSGRIVISGSSTVEPISIGVAEKFAEIAPNVDVSVDGPGTGDGFELFCKGETDISDASRAMQEEEAAACAAAGVNFVELKVAHDGIAVLTSPENDQVDSCLSFSEIYSLVGPESQGFNRWSSANSLAAELGNTKAAPFPDVPLSVTGPGEESGTYDSFVELVLTDAAEGRDKEPQTRPDYQASADDNVIVQGIQGSENSFGWVGYAFYAANEDQLKAFEVAGENGRCVAPSPETISDGSYPISRPLFIYVNSNNLESNPALEQFVELYVSEEGLATAAEVAYVELNEDEAEATRKAFESRASGISAE
ncbi:MAG TPA: phosphate ABC transporter substrate-binding protein PstS family protein [Actinomycetota bacterium]|nr:phosphate ABC transporter substrate-binding protein PstS family protein [Actinomycetota bacterium]